MSAVRNVAKEYQRALTIVRESEVPIIEIDEATTGIVVANQKINYDYALTDGSHTQSDVDNELDTTTRNEDPTIETNEGIATSKQKSDVAPLMTEGRDIELDAIAESDIRYALN